MSLPPLPRASRRKAGQISDFQSHKIVICVILSHGLWSFVTVVIGNNTGRLFRMQAFNPRVYSRFPVGVTLQLLVLRCNDGSSSNSPLPSEVSQVLASIWQALARVEGRKQDLEGKLLLRLFLADTYCVYLWEQVGLLCLGAAYHLFPFLCL